VIFLAELTQICKPATNSHPVSNPYKILAELVVYLHSTGSDFQEPYRSALAGSANITDGTNGAVAPKVIPLKV